eukprot:613939-Pleurochrysis_carterae.AAC.2
MAARLALLKKRVCDNARIDKSTGGLATMRNLHARNKERCGQKAAEEVRLPLPSASSWRLYAPAKADEDAALQQARNRLQVRQVAVPHGGQDLVRSMLRWIQASDLLDARSSGHGDEPAAMAAAVAVAR